MSFRKHSLVLITSPPSCFVSNSIFSNSCCCSGKSNYFKTQMTMLCRGCHCNFLSRARQEIRYHISKKISLYQTVLLDFFILSFTLTGEVRKLKNCYILLHLHSTEKTCVQLNGQTMSWFSKMLRSLCCLASIRDLIGPISK